MSGTPAGLASPWDAAADLARLHRASDDALGLLLELPASLAGALRRCARTASGLEDALRHRLGAWTAGQAEPDGGAAWVLGLDGDGLRRLALCAGAVLHADAVRHLLDGTALRAFVAEVGEEPRAAALRWHALAVTGIADGGETLAARVARDGWRCLHDWCGAQAPAVARRVLLSLPGSVASPDGRVTQGVPIVDALAGDRDAGGCHA